MTDKELEKYLANLSWDSQQSFLYSGINTSTRVPKNHRGAGIKIGQITQRR
jgi:hypothetical protein